MVLLDDLCCRVHRFDVAGKLDAVINSLEVFIYRRGQSIWIIHSLIFVLKFRGCDIPISIDQMI